MDLSVTVVDPLPAPMLRQVGPAVAETVAELHRRHGVSLRLGVGVSELRCHHGRVRAVALADGTELPADAVVVAIGATPAVDWLRGSGLPLGDGVDCDEYCRAAPGVYAAGDVASWMNPRYGQRMRVEHRTNAAEHGTAAAHNLLTGDTEPFTGLPYFWTDQFDVKIQAHGRLREDAEVSIVEGDPADNRFVALYHVDGELTGVLGWNAPARVLPYRKELLHQ
jgi:NADPH-dependent 2,4-dienoyl-CoA reductase/sulfur reductase-like enzyme